jgi:hypothetical protein
MRIASSLVPSLLLVAIAVVCGFGFLSGFGPRGFSASRWLYGFATVDCVVTMVFVWLARGEGQ